MVELQEIVGCKIKYFLRFLIEEKLHISGFMQLKPQSTINEHILSLTIN